MIMGEKITVCGCQENKMELYKNRPVKNTKSLALL